MNESLRIAAWLDANAKHMKYEEERVQMHKAARMIRILENEINSNLDALQKAHDILGEMKAFIQEAAGVPKQEAIREAQRFTMPSLWR